MNYLLELEFTDEEIKKLTKTLNKETINKLNLFPLIVKENYQTLVKIKIKNVKDVFLASPKTFLINPDKFNNILDKYDEEDLIRCLENNPSIIDKI